MDGSPVDVVRAYEYEMHDEIARDQGRTGASSATTPQAVAAPPASQAFPEPPLVGGGRDADSAGVATAPPTLPDSATAMPTADAGFFTTNQYRIVSLEFLDADGRSTTSVRFGGTLRIKVTYECLMAEAPQFSCGLAVAFNRLSDFEAVMYLNTNYPHSDAEMRDYHGESFRQVRAMCGVIEACVHPVQLRAGQYYVSLGILPNYPGPHEFYEYRHCHYVVTVLPNGFDEPAVFYPIVRWRHEAMR